MRLFLLGVSILRVAPALPLAIGMLISLAPGGWCCVHPVVALPIPLGLILFGVSEAEGELSIGICRDDEGC